MQQDEKKWHGTKLSALQYFDALPVIILFIRCPCSMLAWVKQFNRNCQPQSVHHSLMSAWVWLLQLDTFLDNYLIVCTGCFTSEITMQSARLKFPSNLLSLPNTYFTAAFLIFCRLPSLRSHNINDFANYKKKNILSEM